MYDPESPKFNQDTRNENENKKPKKIITPSLSLGLRGFIRAFENKV